MSDAASAQPRAKGGVVRTARSRGIVTGLLLVVLGVWGGLVPFVGPYLGYGYSPLQPWMFTWGRFWLEILPAAAAVLAGLVIMGVANRISGTAAASLAAAAGAWFVVGPLLTQLGSGSGMLGSPAGGTTAQIVEEIGLFTGLGIVIALLAGTALGRFTVRGVRDVRSADREARKGAAPEHVDQDESAAWHRDGNL